MGKKQKKEHLKQQNEIPEKTLWIQNSSLKKKKKSIGSFMSCWCNNNPGLVKYHWTYMPGVGGWPDHVQSQRHCAAGFILSIPQTKKRVAIDTGHDESPGEPKGVGRSRQREARETKKPRRCQPQIFQTAQRMLDFNAHCLALFRV